MNLHFLDIAIIVVYFLAMISVGVLVSRRAAQSLDSYYLGGKSLPWYILGVSNASAMFDITGTMWLVYNIYVYGMKGALLPWLWPIFNQVILMIYLSVWIRRSNVLTGAEWISTRFGSGRGGELSRIVIVIFALVSVIGFISYDFLGMGKFSAVFLPWDLSPNTYAMILMAITSIYVIMGGMLSVVITDVAQFVIMSVSCVVIAIIAVSRISTQQLREAVPDGWSDLSFGWKLNLDWSGINAALNNNVAEDGYSLFMIFFMVMLFKGLLVSIAGPAPNYDMQRVLASRTPKEAALMSGIVSLCMFPRWLMIAGITAIGLVFLGPRFATMGSEVDFEMILPYVIQNFIPIGLVGILMAGLLAAFMSTFSATLNAGSAYIVNDLYKRYLKPMASNRHYMIVSYITPVIILAVGIGFGFVITTINQITQWIVSGLFGGYTAANVLKWHWYRLNGYGYFWGMITGIVAALMMPVLFPSLHPLYSFPYILALSAVASVLGSLLTQPEDDKILKDFYKKVRPWGFWGPVHRLVLNEDPHFVGNKDFARDAVNVLVGIVWQLSIVIMPIYLIMRDMQGLWISLAVFLSSSFFLKKNWLDKLEDEPVAVPAAEPVDAAPRPRLAID
jgi:solute:Na+ symporter, SSS family